MFTQGPKEMGASSSRPSTIGTAVGREEVKSLPLSLPESEHGGRAIPPRARKAGCAKYLVMSTSAPRAGKIRRFFSFHFLDKAIQAEGSVRIGSPQNRVRGGSRLVGPRVYIILGTSFVVKIKN